MPNVSSRDGTTIAFTKAGSGPAVILVDGALCSRAMGPMSEIAPLLAGRFTVFTYDRRGRNESTDTPPYAVQREVEDIGALIQEAGGSASLFGVSSGAALALEAANSGLTVPKLALFEAPFIVDDSRTPLPPDYYEEMERLIAADRRSDAVQHFMRKGVQIPAPIVLMMRLMPAWPKLKAVAHTLKYDALILDGNQAGRPLPKDRWTNVTMPTLVIGGGKSPAWMLNAVKATADAIPGSKHVILPGQTHMVKASAIAPPLIEFFAS